MAAVVDIELHPLATNAGTDFRYGLSSPAARQILASVGPNEIVEVAKNPYLIMLSYFTGPIAYLIELAALFSILSRQWFDFAVIMSLLIVNAIVGYNEESRAESALRTLKKSMAQRCHVRRDGILSDISAVGLVPGDIILLRMGDVVPADARLLGVGPDGGTQAELQLNQASVTGESFPVRKSKGDIAFSGSVVGLGEMLAEVVATGEKTQIGKAAKLISRSEELGSFQKTVNKIGNFLIIVTLVTVVVVFLIQIVRFYNGTINAPTPDTTPHSWMDIVNQALVLTLASVPVGLPTFLSVTMAIGAKGLAKKKVVVRRLPAIEELASVSVLCCDKTGTLTLNQLSVDTPFLSAGRTNEELMLYAYLASEMYVATDAIDVTIKTTAEATLPLLRNRPPAVVSFASGISGGGTTTGGVGNVGVVGGSGAAGTPVAGSHDGEGSRVPGYTVSDFIPFNSFTKRSEATVHVSATGVTFKVTKGAPQVILDLVTSSNTTDHQAVATAAAAVTEFASRGYRALGVAQQTGVTSTGTPQWSLVGLISILDPPRSDAASMIRECQRLGVQVKMITGDQTAISREVARRLGLPGVIEDGATLLSDIGVSEQQLMDLCQRVDGFAQVTPEHKYRIIELFKKANYMVAMTGDGVNDAPALTKADVGIAVQGSSDAACSAADIVLLAPGLSTIVDGIKTARTIFQRIRSYSLYSIVSSIHFLLFTTIAIIVFDWTLAPSLILIMAILNDTATVVISTDNAQISKKPDIWNLKQLLALSCVMAVVLTVSSFGHFFLARDFFQVTPGQLETIMYLQLSASPHFVIFSTRLTGFFWKRSPSLIFFVAIFGTQVVAMFLSIYGLFSESIGWAWGLSILAMAVVVMVVLDVIKVVLLKYWKMDEHVVMRGAYSGVFDDNHVLSSPV